MIALPRFPRVSLASHAIVLNPTARGLQRCVETAPGPERATPGGRYSLLFAIKVALDKYLDHIPLACQERILRRHGVDVTTQTARTRAER